MRWDKAQKDAIMRERLMDCAQSAGGRQNMLGQWGMIKLPINFIIYFFMNLILISLSLSAGVQYSVNHPHLTVSELDESVNHTVHNLFRSNFKLPEEQEIMDVSVVFVRNFVGT